MIVELILFKKDGTSESLVLNLDVIPKNSERIVLRGKGPDEAYAVTEVKHTLDRAAQPGITNHHITIAAVHRD